MQLSALTACKPKFYFFLYIMEHSYKFGMKTNQEDQKTNYPKVGLELGVAKYNPTHKSNPYLTHLK